jgi:hypothetical protein
MSAGSSTAMKINSLPAKSGFVKILRKIKIAAAF